MKDFKEIRRYELKNLNQLREGISDAMEAFAAVGEAAYKEGHLPAKVKELIALAIAITDRCDGCVAFHARSACAKGATREEILETIAVALQMGGGPSMVYGSEALQAYDQFCAGKNL